MLSIETIAFVLLSSPCILIQENRYHPWSWWTSLRILFHWAKIRPPVPPFTVSCQNSIMPNWRFVLLTSTLCLGYKIGTPRDTGEKRIADQIWASEIETTGVGVLVIWIGLTFSLWNVTRGWDPSYKVIFPCFILEQVTSHLNVREGEFDFG